MRQGKLFQGRPRVDGIHRSLDPPFLSLSPYLRIFLVYLPLFLIGPGRVASLDVFASHRIVIRS